MPLTAPAADRAAKRVAQPLIRRLAEALDREEVRYCQWKGFGKEAKWTKGEGDLDLLIDGRARSTLVSILGELGFKEAMAPGPWQFPGIESWFGHDPQSDRLIHVHVHFRLVLGEPWRTTYHIPLEEACLASAGPRGLFRGLSAEAELVTLTLRALLRYRLRDAPASADPRWLRDLQDDLAEVVRRARIEKVADLLIRHLPDIDIGFFERCSQSLRRGVPAWHRLLVKRALQHRLTSFARRPSIAAIMLAVFRHPGGHRPASGGLLVAINGGDGTGKSTCTEQLTRWLGSDLRVKRFHLGRPPRSAATMIVGAALKVARRFGLGSRLELLRFVGTARDRYRVTREAWQQAAAGGIALCERYPVPLAWPLVGPSAAQGLGTTAETWMTRVLRRWEKSYYERIAEPDLSIMLLADPEVAVKRKTNEPAEYVRARNQKSWETDWSRTGIHTVNADRRLAEVLGDLKSVVWSRL